MRRQALLAMGLADLDAYGGSEMVDDPDIAGCLRGWGIASELP